MRVKVILENGETPDDAEFFLEKALRHKHEKSHSEKFQDDLFEELLAELDIEMKRTVLVGGFEESMKELMKDRDVD